MGVRNGRGTDFSSFAVLEKPQHGRVGIFSQGYSAWVYQSAPGYRGKDHLVGVINGKSWTLGVSGTSKLDVSVDVQ